MNDSKTEYSEASKQYVNEDAVTNPLDIARLKRSLDRKEKYGKNWEKNPVNLNEIVSIFCPDATEKTESGVKYVFQNELYKIECDKGTGYLRIFDKKLKKLILIFILMG